MEVERDDEVNEATLATLPDVHPTVSLARLKRLGNITVNRLGAVGVDIEFEVRPHGRFAIIMAPEWAPLHVANFEALVVGFKEKVALVTGGSRGILGARGVFGIALRFLVPLCKIARAI